MGNIDDHDMVGAISAIERTLFRIGKDVLGKGVAILQKGLV